MTLGVHGLLNAPNGDVASFVLVHDGRRLALADERETGALEFSSRA